MEKLLPTDITLDIFSRLPAESVLECKQVCKTWRTLLNDPSFAQMHLRCQQRLLSQQLHEDDDCDQYYSLGGGGGGELGFIFMASTETWSSKTRTLWYQKYDEKDRKSYRRVKRINYPPIKKNDDRYISKKLIGSCNGLVCLTERHQLIDDPVYICNPITREYVNLQRFIVKRGYPIYNYMASGFGYNYSTNEYKVVRVYYPGNCSRSPGRVQVYTLGSGSGWRDKGEITYSLRSKWGVFANGELHWLINDPKKIVAFNLADEEFHFIVLPPPFGISSKLCVLGGWLCLFRYSWDLLSPESPPAEIWLFKKKTSSSYNVVDINKKLQEYQSWSWSKEFTIKIDELYHEQITPLALTKRGNEVLLLFNDCGCLCRYSRKSTKLTRLMDTDKELTYFEAICHVNSFVSLEALGENSRTRKRKYV